MLYQRLLGSNRPGSVVLHELGYGVLHCVAPVPVDALFDLLVYPVQDLPVHVDAGSALTQSMSLLASFKIVKEPFLYLSKKIKRLFLCFFNQRTIKRR